MKNPAPTDKVVKYIKARQMGKNKTESKAIAGYSVGTMPRIIENTDAYKKLTIKDSLLKHISLDEMTEIHQKLIRSDNPAVALGSLKLGYERIEPDSNVVEDNESITVILKG
jgi:hypothetical protein